MPVFSKSMTPHQINGATYGFSAKRIEELGASEYTLGIVVVDVSGSVSTYRDEIEATVKQVVRSCRHNPRADNMMLRVVIFDDKVDEVHGFKPLTECHENDYDGAIQIGGMTALYDAAYNAVASITQYGKALTMQDFDVNAALFVITDGMDNHSKATRQMVGQAFSDAITGEHIESLVSVLIGVNTDSGGLNDYLKAFKQESGFDQYVAIGSATEKELAKLGGFVSRSISMQSQALGTGGPSQSLSF